MVLDWSNIAFRALYTTGGFGNAMTFSTSEEIQMYIGKVATDLTALLRAFNPYAVVFCADARHSWRKDVIDTYKQNRVRSEKLNWDMIFTALDKFRKHLETMGFVFAETPHAEADDMMCLIKELLFKDSDMSDYNCICVTSDADIRQLIGFSKTTSQYFMVYNEIGKGRDGKCRLFTDADIMQWYNTCNEQITIFNMTGDEDKAYIRNILESNPKIILEETDPANILLSKIFCGDDGDNVPAFYNWFSKTGHKTRITNTKFVKIIESLDAHNIADIEANKSSLKEVIETVIKKEITDIDVIDRLDRQKKLVELKSEIFPESIRKYSGNIKHDILAQNLSINFIGLKMEDLVKDSEYAVIAQKNRHRDADIFTGLNKYLDGAQGETDTLW